MVIVIVKTIRNIINGEDYMHVKLKGQEFLIQTLNDWYISIRSRDVSSAKTQATK